MKRHAACLAIIAALLLPAAMAGRVHALELRVDPHIFKPEAAPPAKLADAHTLIERAKDAVANNRPTLKTDLDNLFLKLLQSRNVTDQYNLIYTIGEIGSIRRSASPVAVKAYVQQLVLIVFPKLRKRARNYAGMVWGGIFPSGKVIEREIGIVAPESRTEEAAGLKVLRDRRLGVSYESLGDAVIKADVELAKALLQAGLKVDMVNIESTYGVVWPNLRIACADPTIPANWINNVLSLLVEHGYPIDYADSFGKTLLFMAASNCSGAVVAHIADLGASIDSRTRNGMTPLETALQSDRFDAADALMERGARLSATAAKRVLLFPRQDSRRTDYAKRATKVEDDANK